MTTSPAILHTIEQLKARLDELRPAHDEYRRLIAFGEDFHRFLEKGSKVKAPSQPTPTRARHGETLRRIREIVAAHPQGISIGEIIEEGQLSSSYTYDVVKRLVAAGEFAKRGGRVYPGERQAVRP